MIRLIKIFFCCMLSILPSSTIKEDTSSIDDVSYSTLSTTNDSTNLEGSDEQVYTYIIDSYYNATLYYANKGTLSDNKVGLMVGFDLTDEVKNNMLTGDLDKLVVKYKYCKWGIHFGSHCLKSVWKTETIESTDTLKFGSTTINQMGKWEDIDLKRKATNDFFGDDNITASIKPMSIPSDLVPYLHLDKVKYFDEMRTYDYYFVIDKTFVVRDWVISATYINVTGEEQTDICPDGGCFVGGTPLTGIDAQLDKIINLLDSVIDFFTSNWPLILLFIVTLLIGIWVTPLMNLITGVIKMVIKILDYAWTTIVNACIGIHNIWFWLWVRDDYKRKQKMISYRKYK